MDYIQLNDPCPSTYLEKMRHIKTEETIHMKLDPSLPTEPCFILIATHTSAVVFFCFAQTILQAFLNKQHSHICLSIKTHLSTL